MKKILASLLALCMVMAMVPFSFAAGGTVNGYTTFAEAVTNAVPVDGVVTYKISGNVDYPHESNGHSLHLVGTTGVTKVVIEGTDDSAVLNVTGYNGANGADNDINPDAVEIEIKNIKITDNQNHYTTDSGWFVVSIAGSKVTLTDVTTENVSLRLDSACGGLSINGGTFNGPEGYYPIFIDNIAGDFTITDAVIKSARGIKIGDARYQTYDGTATIENCTFEGLSKKPAVNVSHVDAATASVKIINATLNECSYGLLANEVPGSDVTVDGKEPEYVAVWDGNLYTNADYAQKEADEKGETASTPVATVENSGGKSYYATLQAAIEAAKSGDTVEIVQAGTYVLPGFSTVLTVKAAEGVEVTIDNNGAKTLSGAKVVFEKLIFDYYPNKDYTGLQHIDTAVYNNCTFNGQVFLYGNSEIFNNCTFNQNSSGSYNVWTYGAKYVEFNGCTFNCEGKAALVYNEGGPKTELVVTDTKFIAKQVVSGKAAIEVDTSSPNKKGGMDGTSITIDDKTTATGFDAGSVSGSSLWNDKKNLDNLVINVAGEQVWPVVVAAIGEQKFSSLQAALDTAASMSGSVTVEILADIDLENVDWNPVTVSAPGYPFVTVNGNNHTIFHLNDMLFGSTWAGKSGLVINDLTIADSVIVNDKDDTKGTVGVGAFIGYPQASEIITLENCHLVNSSVEGGHWTGGLIGMAGGYNGNDGPVFMTLTIKDCSVTGSTITGKGSAGGIVGHATCAEWTKFVIENSEVKNNTITSTGSATNKAGTIMGTVGAAGKPTTVKGETKTGGVYVAATESGNTVTSNGTVITTVYGRQGSANGVLTITGGEYDNRPINESDSAWANPKEDYVIVQNPAGKYILRSAFIAKIGETQYKSLAEAVAAVQDGQNIELLASPEANDIAVVSKAISFTVEYANGISFAHNTAITAASGLTLRFSGRNTDTGSVVSFVIGDASITYDPNGGSSPVSNLTFPAVIGSEATLYGAKYFTAPDGKQFKAWEVNGVQYAAGAKITITGNTVVKAIWEDAPVEEDTSIDYQQLLMLLALMNSQKYDVEATVGAGATLTTDGAAQIKFNKSQDYTIELEDGYVVTDVIVNGKSIGAVTEFTLKNVRKDQKVEIVTERVNPYADLAGEAAYYDIVLDLYYRGIMNGDGVNFGAEETLTRAQLVTVLWRAAGEPAVAWAYELGIMEGDGVKNFYVDDNITVEELCTVIYRWVKLNGGGYEDDSWKNADYADIKDVSDWALEAVVYFAENEILPVADGKLNPNADALRWLIAVMVYPMIAA